MPSSEGDWYGSVHIFPAAVQHAAPVVHALADLAVFLRAFDIRLLVQLDQLTLEQRDLLRIVILDDVHAFFRVRADEPS